MASRKSSGGTQDAGDEPAAMSKPELERQLAETRESLAHTVHEIKETVSGQYEAVRDSVSGVLDYREQFEKEPLVWSLGALSAGFALGYTLGYAHKNSKGSKAKQSQIAAFADSMASELSTVGKTFVMPALNSKIKELFGFDFGDALENLGQGGPAKTKRSATRLPPRKTTAPKKKAVKKKAKRV